MHIPTPEEVKSRIQANLDVQSSALMQLCIKALNTATTPTIRVDIPEKTSAEAIDHVRKRLESAGWSVRHWVGSQRDPDNALHISVPGAS